MIAIKNKITILFPLKIAIMHKTQIMGILHLFNNFVSIQHSLYLNISQINNTKSHFNYIPPIKINNILVFNSKISLMVMVSYCKIIGQYAMGIFQMEISTVSQEFNKINRLFLMEYSIIMFLSKVGSSILSIILSALALS
jgi:hypothetical protein